MKRYDAVNTDGDPLYAPSPDGEMVFYSDVAQWVSVDEKLPEVGDFVLIFVREAVTIVEFRNPDRVHWKNWGHSVTHWQPLPLPPSEGG
tara:strand:- start:189 stop:455 length:267 start_codon:yes stop_codon:yes gene_type:complete